MTRTEHLLAILAEECDEVSQRALKALRFRPDEVQPGQPMTNMERVYAEAADLLAALEMLHEAGLLGAMFTPTIAVRELMDAKKAKVEKYMAFSLGQTPHPELSKS